VYSAPVAALLRTVVFAIFVPGTVAVLVPRWILPAGARWHTDAAGIFALSLAAAGAAIYFWCAFWVFASYGHGTPLPLDPPKRLVAHELYRVMRNPMYMGRWNSPVVRSHWVQEICCSIY
jgi:protein-S-isoprenylcysteine O-methyltransferase Ste14